MFRLLSLGRCTYFLASNEKRQGSFQMRRTDTNGMVCKELVEVTLYVTEIFYLV